MTEKQIARYQLVSRFSALAMLLFGAVATSGLLSKIMIFDGASLTQGFALLATASGLVTKWASGLLPSSKAKP